ncbi:MAG: proton-conducting transporter membrane subunit, partial [Nocardioidaceae bacterium]
MTDFPWLTVIAAVPLAGAVLVMLLPRGRGELPKQAAFGISLVPLVLAAIMASDYDPGGGFQFTEEHTWIEAFGAHYAVGVDGIGLSLILMTTVLTPVVILASWHDGEPGRWSVNAYFGWMLALEGLAIGVFAATDVFLFYVLFEATLIPIYFLIGGYGGAQRSYAAVKFLLYSLLGGLLM